MIQLKTKAQVARRKTAEEVCLQTQKEDLSKHGESTLGDVPAEAVWK